MANVKINTTNTSGGYAQPVNPNTTGVVASGFYPQNATSNDADAGIERSASETLELKAGGATRIYINSTGGVSIDTPTVDQYALSISGAGGVYPALGVDGNVSITNGAASSYGGFYAQRTGTLPDTAVSMTRDSSDNLVLTDPVVGALTLSQISSATVDVFTASSGTYTKPAGATMARMLLMGGGGGGSSGSTGANTTSRAGGGGGGAGQLVDVTISLAQISAGVTVAVGSGGTGASSAAATAGGNGGSTTFGSVGDAFYTEAMGGVGGSATGTGGNSYATVIGGTTSTPSATYRTGGGGQAINNATNGLASYSSGGGGGGGLTSTVERLGGGSDAAPPVGALSYSRGNQAAALGTTAASTDGSTGNTTQLGAGINASVYFGSGGSGGGGSQAGTPGNGGAGAANSGGGGGGGGAGTTPLYGNGGNGGSGWAVIISW